MKKLKNVGAELFYLSSSEEKNIPKTLRNLLIADDQTVDNFIIRDVRQRLSKRDADAVKEWMLSGRAVHCIKDHISHTDRSIVSGLWGANQRKLMAYLGKLKMKDLIQVHKTLYK